MDRNIVAQSILVNADPDDTRSPAELAAVVRTEIQNCRKALSNALDHAMNAGDALLAAEPKVLAAGSSWNKWLRDNCFIARSTAFLYMQLAEHRAEIEAKLQEGVELSLRAARRLISKPRDDADESGGHGDGDPDPPETDTLIACWKRSSAKERASFLDQIGVDAVLEMMSTAFGQDLRSRVPAPKKRKTINLTATNSAQPRDNPSRH